MPSERRQTALNLATGIGALATQMLTGFFLSSFVVAHMGEAANGFTQLANNFVTYAQLLTLAFNSMGARFMSVSYHRGEHDKVRAYYSTMVACNIVAVAVLLLPAALVVVNLGSFLDMGDASLIDVQLLFACVFANFFANLFLSALFAATYVRNRVSIRNVVNLVRTVLNAVLLVCVFTALPPHVYYVSLVALLLTLALLPVAWRVRERLLPEARHRMSEFSRDALRELVSSGVWNTVNQCGHMLMTGFDLLFANWFVGASAMGVLSVAKVVPNAMISLASTINSNFEPGLVISLSHGGMEGLVARLRSGIRLSNLVLSVPIATFVAFSHAFYVLWMPSLDATQLSWLSFLSIMAFVPWAGPQVMYNVFTATNHLKVNSVAFVLSGVLNFVAVCALLSWTSLGTYAIAGVSSAITIVRNVVITVPYVSRLTGQPCRVYYGEALWSLTSCAMSLAVGIGIQVVAAPTTWVAILAEAMVSCVLSWAVVGLLTLGPRERERLASIAKRGLNGLKMGDES